MTRSVELVLFDLDGTLADTAPDLAAAANRMRNERGLAALPLERLRPVASHGARGLLQVALGRKPDDPDYEALRVEFLACYEAALCVHSKLFDGMEATLSALEAAGIAWGIVTNKVARFTVPLVAQLGLADRAVCVVSGDTTAHPKPDPAPIRHAIAIAGARSNATFYVGDDLRDIQAGRAAAVTTVAAAYGYLGNELDIRAWNSDYLIDQPPALLSLAGIEIDR